MIHVLYFARLREQLGTAGEELAAPTPLTAGALIDRLAERGGRWAEVFDPGPGLLVAVNQSMARPDTLLRDGDEVAFFPPVTGG